MVKEIAKCGFTDSDSMLLKMKECHDKAGFSVRGDTIDRIFDAQGHLIDEIHGHNLIVNTFLNLVMCLFKHESGYEGIQYWAVGSGGSDAWGSGDPPLPDIDATRLTNEIGRVAIDPAEIVFLDQDYVETPSPSNIIQIKHLFGMSECNGEWREFGIFGGNATSAANSGIMINKRHHRVISKTGEISVERTMRFTINLV